MAAGNTTVSPASIWIRNSDSFILYLMSQLACPLSSPFLASLCLSFLF